MKNSIDIVIKKTLYGLLKEESEDKDKDKKETSKDSRSSSKFKGVISTAGAFGSGGRSKRFITQAGSRAKKDPKGLMKDLGVDKKSSGGDLDAALDILRKAIHSNLTMSEAYTGVKKTVDQVTLREKTKNVNVLAVTLGSLDRKNGVRFLALTLNAARDANFLNLSGGLQFGKGSKHEIVIYSI